MRLYSLLALVLLSVTTQAQDLVYSNHELSGQTLTVEAGDIRVRLTAHTNNAIEVVYDRAGIQTHASYAIAGEPEPVNATVDDSEDTLVFSAPGIRAVVRKAPLTIAFYRGSELLVEEGSGFFAYESILGFRFRLSAGERLIGGGQRVVGMDRRGKRLPLYNRPAYGYTTESEQMYFGIPAVLSTRKYLLLFDNVARGVMDIGYSEPDVLQFEAVAGRSAYVVVAGDTYPEVIGNYVAVTGRQPLPPRWAFGNFVSRFGYRSQSQVLDTVERHIDDGFPVDAVVLDLYWFGPDIQGHMGRLDWDRAAFPDPVGMMAELEDRGVKTVLITEPFILSSSSRWAEAVAAGVLARNPAGDPRTFDFYFGNTGLIDVFDVRAQSWFWDILRGLMEQGVDGWWGDLGEPEVHPIDTIHINGAADEVHNAFGHTWAAGLFRHHERDYPDRRPFIMMRSGFAGSQRYGMIPWTGDVSRSWGGLQSQVELALQMGLLGLGYIHSDLGGFADGERFDRELYVRWLQYGAFQPVFRPHAQEHIPSEPVFHDRRTRDIVREYVRLRYRLLPYTYTLAWENSATGMPLMRPLMFEDEADTGLVDNADSYLWGNAFLVTPVVQPGRKWQDVMLPRGVWFDFWTDERIDGGRTVRVRTPLERIPVLVRAGAFVPMIDDIATTRDYRSTNLTLHFYDDESIADSESVMYEDDGAMHRAFEKGLYEVLNFSARRADGKRVISLSRQGRGYAGMPDRRRIELVVHNRNTAPALVRVGGRPIPVEAQGRDDQATGDHARHDARGRRLVLMFDWDHQPVNVELDP